MFSFCGLNNIFGTEGVIVCFLLHNQLRNYLSTPPKKKKYSSNFHFFTQVHDLEAEKEFPPYLEKAVAVYFPLTGGGMILGKEMLVW